MKIILTVFFLVMFVNNVSASTPQEKSKEFSLGYAENKAVYRDLLLTTAVLTAVGVNEWDWFKDSPKSYSEGWFGKDTRYGGSDKTGHMYTTFLLSEVLIWDFRRNNIDHAIEKAALTSLAAMTFLEIGDATSTKFGFSPEDFVMNALGSGTSYLLAKYPSLDKKIDFRMEYKPSKGLKGNKLDFHGDYSGMKHLFAIKADGFDSLQNTPLKYLELHLGYYTRGYRSQDKGFYEKSRNPYLGIGINLQRLFGNKPITRVFEYYQPPSTYFEAK